MNASQSTLSRQEHIRRGREFYDRQIRPAVEGKHQGKVVAIDVLTGAYEVGEDMLTSSDRLLTRYPDALTYFVRVGFPGVHRFGVNVHAEGA